MWGGYTAGVCPCRKNHRPTPRRLNRHHVQPLSWNGPDTLDNQIDICPTTHVNTHMLIDLYRKYAALEPKFVGVVPASVLHTFSFLERRLAQFAWEHRPSDHPPLTSEHVPGAVA